MTKKKTPNELYWSAKKDTQIRDEYNSFLAKKNENGSPHMAHLFAIKMIGSGFEYMGMKERDLILFLEGNLPEMYD